MKRGCRDFGAEAAVAASGHQMAPLTETDSHFEEGRVLSQYRSFLVACSGRLEEQVALRITSIHLSKLYSLSERK